MANHEPRYPLSYDSDKELAECTTWLPELTDQADRLQAASLYRNTYVDNCSSPRTAKLLRYQIVLECFPHAGKIPPKYRSANRLRCRRRRRKKRVAKNGQS